MAFEVMLVRGAVVAKRGSFEMLPNAFVRVELVGVRRQVLRHQPRVCSEPVFDKPAAVSADVVPENDDPARNVAQQGLQEAQHLVALDAAAHQMQVQPSTTSDAGNSRELGPTEWMTDDRRLAAPRPSPSGWWNQREAALVHEYQARTPALGVFFTWGQRFCTQRRTVASSRSRAWRTGFCQLQPQDRSNHGMNLG